jgi:hypothetical protein
MAIKRQRAIRTAGLWKGAEGNEMMEDTQTEQFQRM